MVFEKEKQENLRRITAFEENGPQEGFDGTVSFFPRYLQIEHTTRCNARCIMCNHLYTGNRGCRDLDTEVLYALEDILKYAETVMLNGDGEPFLYPDIDKSLSLFHKYGVSIGTNTNLTVMSDKTLDYLSDGFSFINISCDGSEKNLFEEIRRGLSFDTFINNLKKLNRTAPDLKKNLDCVLMRQNITDMEALVRFAADYGFASVRFHTLGVNPIIGNHEDAPYLYPHALSVHSDAAREEASRLGIELQLPDVAVPGNETYEKELERSAGAELRARERIASLEKAGGADAPRYLSEQVTEETLTRTHFAYGNMCRWAIERCYIDIDGSLTTCCYDVMHRYGNLREQSFREIWNGPLYRKLRTEMVKGCLPVWCKACEWIKNPVF